ncbi:hypothetical protein ARALYDRAFT_890639 [Arabidopsis lyrata subsp. lyrata]|uniref:F-box associated beta-propeller type 3 domain-containing protein n=1 Tax=Arabidopsis lyrata subsp. lyrata TaxID=81972 RepID=D7KFP5_ARALL|nr:hypothetical protein ARALYDRAFT_890639 [Arabidopsis lyrata subsp. lyrata]
MIPSGSFSSGSYCASVHGLIGCISTGPVTVCNPSTGKVTTFPVRTSLGYDPIDDKIKALTVVSTPYRNHDFLMHEVVTLGRRRIFMDTYERLSFIKAPMDVISWEGESILIEYKGKLAFIVRHPYADFESFDLWILEDVKTHDLSNQTFELPFSLGLGTTMTSPGTNKAGEIIFAPKALSPDVQPFYIFYYNVERKDMRRVRLLGIADYEEFRSRYGFANDCYVSISPEHIESIASF